MTIDFDVLKNANIDNIVQLRDVLNEWIHIYNETNYVEVTILNREGNITREIHAKFPDFDISWHADEPGTIGENRVVIPRDKWNDDVKNELIKFDSFAGPRKTTHVEYEPKEGVDLPYEIKNLIDAKRNVMKDKNKKISFTYYDLNCRRLANYISTYFNEITVVDREWFEPLWVHDYIPSGDTLRYIKVDL